MIFSMYILTQKKKGYFIHFKSWINNFKEKINEIIGKTINYFSKFHNYTFILVDVLCKP